MDSTLSRWQPWSVEQVVLLFGGAPFRWCISGGHALERHVGDAWRGHEDLDVGVCRYQMPEVYRWLEEWDLQIAAAGRLTRWDGRPLDSTLHENNVWVRESPDSPWRFDLSVGAGSPREWAYRRDQSVTRPWDRAVLSSPSDIPYFAPELQLLFKAKHPRPKDHLDAERVIPALDTQEHEFISAHLSPEHQWRKLLANTTQTHS